MGGFAAAWITGLGIVVWREVHDQHRPPVPGALAGVTGLFLALDLIANAAPSSRRVVTLVAWGLNIAGLLQVLPGGLYGQIQQTQSAEAVAQGETSPSAGGTSGGGGSERAQ